MARKRRFTIFKVLLLLVAAVVVWVMVSLQSLQDLLQAYQERNREREQVEMLEERIRLLERQRTSLQLSGLEMERQLREYYGMVRKGEKVIYLASDNEISTRADELVGELPTTPNTRLAPSAEIEVEKASATRKPSPNGKATSPAGVKKTTKQK